MISPYLFINKRNPFEGLQGFFYYDNVTTSIPPALSIAFQGTNRELLPRDFETSDSQGIHVFDSYLETPAKEEEINAFLSAVEAVYPPKEVDREAFMALLGSPDPTLKNAIDQLFDYIDHPENIRLFFGSSERGYTEEKMHTHLRRIVSILSSVIRTDALARQNVITTLIENIQFNGGCAQGYRNRLYAIVATLT